MSNERKEESREQRDSRETNSLRRINLYESLSNIEAFITAFVRDHPQLKYRFRHAK